MDPWSKLSLEEKKDLIKLYVRSGLKSFSAIKDHYNSIPIPSSIPETIAKQRRETQVDNYIHSKDVSDYFMYHRGFNPKNSINLSNKEMRSIGIEPTTGQETANALIQTYRSLGYTDRHISALLGNYVVESNLNPGSKQIVDNKPVGPGTALEQRESNSDRFKQFQEFKNNPKNWSMYLGIPASQKEAVATARFYDAVTNGEKVLNEMAKTGIKTEKALYPNEWTHGNRGSNFNSYQEALEKLTDSTNTDVGGMAEGLARTWFRPKTYSIKDPNTGKVIDTNPSYQKRRDVSEWMYSKMSDPFRIFSTKFGK